MPLAIYDAVFSGDTSVVRAFIILSTAICFIVCVLAARLAPPRA
jgi:hypothetical protein